MLIKNRCWIIHLSLFSLLTSMAILKYHNLNSTILDLGIFINNFYMISEGHWERLFLSHIQPLSFIWSLSFKIFPDDAVPYFILAEQAFLLTFPVVILYRSYGIIPTVAFALYFPLWYNALFDFHLDHLAIPFLLGFFIMERKGKIGLAVFFGFLLALVKEIFTVQAIFCGIYLFIIRKHRLGGSILTLASLVYFFIGCVYLKTYFNPDVMNNNQAPIGVYSWLGNSFQEIILAILTKPFWILKEIFSNEERVKYIFYLFGALGFIPFLRPGVLWVTIPILAHSLLSLDPKHYGFTHHYSAGLLIPNIIAFAEGIPRAKRLWKHIKLKKQWFEPILCAGLIVCHILLSPSPISLKFYNPGAGSHYFAVYIPSERNQIIKTALKTHIPSDPEEIISIQNSMNFSYLMRRKTFKVFPHGAVVDSPIYGKKLTWLGFIDFIRTGKPYTSSIENASANYVVLDLKRPWFIVGQGCYWVSNKCKDDEQFKVYFLDLVSKTRQDFDTIFKEDGFIILKRRNSSDTS